MSDAIKSDETFHSTYSVQVPYTASFSFSDDAHHTKITIDSTSEVLRYGRDEHDIHLQMELDQAHGKSTYAKHLISWVNDRLSEINPREVNVTYGDTSTIEIMTDEQIDQFREDCLNDG